MNPTVALLQRVAGEGVPPRTLVVFAHPDDEVLALGGRLERWHDALFVCVTDGAPADGADARAHGFLSLEQYRAARRDELHAALAHAGLPPSAACALEIEGAGSRTQIPDQAPDQIPDHAPPAGPHQIPDQQAALHLAAAARALLALLRQVQPEVVLTHPYEGGHPDHDSCAFAVHAAVRLLAADSPHARGAAPSAANDEPAPTDRSTRRPSSPSLPVIVEAPSYFASPGGMATGCFLPHAEAGEPVRTELREAEQAAKRERLACFPSQRQTLAQFSCAAELFRLAPPYCFADPPHAGELFYERFPWGMTGERFRELARAAEQELGLAGAGA